MLALGHLATGSGAEVVRTALALALDDPEPFVRDAAALAPRQTKLEQDGMGWNRWAYATPRRWNQLPDAENGP